MNNTMMQALLWIAAGLVLVLYLMRRSRRKKRTDR
jgi:hypothetical protein